MGLDDALERIQRFGVPPPSMWKTAPVLYGKWPRAMAASADASK